MRNVTLILDDGSRFSGKSFGYEKPVAGEVVFNTAMTGYPESLTDPSYAGQLMTLTYPLVGNYGVPPFTIRPNGLAAFMESECIHAEAIIVSEEYSHWNAKESLADWLKREQVPGITGIDTRELTKVLREHGVMMGKIVFDDDPDNQPEARYEGINYVDKVSCKEVIRYNEGADKKKVVLVDCDMRLPTVAHKLGIKRSPGLSDYLVGEKSINECIFSVSKLGFAVVPAGNIPPDPTTLLESKEMRELLGVLRNYYDYIIVDLPPVLPVPDAMILSKHIDGYLIVVKSGTAEYRNVSDALKQLQFADSNIIGFVYNGKPLPSKRSRKYRYNYTYYKKK